MDRLIKAEVLTARNLPNKAMVLSGLMMDEISAGVIILSNSKDVSSQGGGGGGMWGRGFTKSDSGKINKSLVLSLEPYNIRQVTLLQVRLQF